jgi:hypothetical protein
MEVKMRRKVSAVEEVIGRKQSVQHTLEDITDRKASIASVLSMGQERMRMRINFYQWLAIRRWEGVEKKEMQDKKKKKKKKNKARDGWRIWARRLMGKTKGDEGEGEKKDIMMLKDVLVCI